MEDTGLMLAKELQATAVLDEKAARRKADGLAVRFTARSVSFNSP